jgi:hypothetical protein
MNHEDCDQALALADWDDAADSAKSYLALLSDLLTEWTSEADSEAYDDL